MTFSARPEIRRALNNSCPICGGSWLLFLKTTYGQSLSGDQKILLNDLDKVICNSCGLVANHQMGGDSTIASYERDYQLNTTSGEEHIYFTESGAIPRSE